MKDIIIQFSEEWEVRGFAVLYDTMLLGQKIHSLNDRMYVVNSFQTTELDNHNIPYKTIQGERQL